MHTVTITLPANTVNAKLRNLVRFSRLRCNSRFHSCLIVIHVSLQFADSWSACIAQSQSNSRSSNNSTPVGSSNPPMKSMRGVVGTITSFLLSPSKDTGQGRPQVVCSLFMTSTYFIQCRLVVVFDRERLYLRGMVQRLCHVTCLKLNKNGTIV